jgi:hypothetical protein
MLAPMRDRMAGCSVNAKEVIRAMKSVPAGGPRLRPIADLAVQAAAVVLMVAGAALMLTAVLDAAIAIPAIAFGIARVAIERTDQRRRQA